jgi:hypothetical protein
MKNLTTNKKLMTILAISVAASLAIPYVLATTTSAPIPTIPSQCTTAIATGWSTSPIINARMTIHNDEDSGLVGYWALDNFVESFVIWQNNDTTPNTFCALDQYSGTWKTFAGALSPQNGVEEPNGASGSMNAAIVKIFTGTFLGPYCKATKTYTCSGTYSAKPTTGNIGSFNLGGTKSQILLGTYTKQKAFNPTSFLTFYFKTPSIISEPAWSWVYALGNGVGYGNMWVNDLTGSFGDIL